MFEVRETRLTVVTEGGSIIEETATTVEIDDEGAGEFVAVSQCLPGAAGKTLIDPKEWPALRGAIDRMIKACRDDD